ALADADQAGIAGKALTPFLLARMEDLTGGRSLEANVALVLNNADVATAIAVDFARVQTEVALPPKMPINTRTRYF
ncbi:MAG TPA: pseudouridine-5'-phosphate glycosidase, partial [Azospirillaceae bacterium]|nr:pseudouridine-5'-phosphate glycosidase [Azospirillaceae bacterium]